MVLLEIRGERVVVERRRDARLVVRLVLVAELAGDLARFLDRRVFTWFASTFVFHSVNESDVVFVVDLGANRSSRVSARPITQNVCIQRGVGVGGPGFGGSFGGPDFAGLERCTWNVDIDMRPSIVRHSQRTP